MTIQRAYQILDAALTTRGTRPYPPEADLREAAALLADYDRRVAADPASALAWAMSL